MEFVYVVMFIKNEGGALELGSVHESKQSAKEWIFTLIVIVSGLKSAHVE